MSNPVQRGPGNDAFGGGALIRASPPTSGPTGALPGANTSTPLGGVNPPSTPFFARPNSGTNIRIPYNRVVPLSDPRGGGLSAVVKSGADNSSSPEEWYTHMHADTQSKTLMSETDTLHATRIAFVLAKKSNDQMRFSKDNQMDAQEFSYAINSAIAPTLPGTQKLQKLCSLEYLQRYIDKTVNQPGLAQTIDLGARPAAANAADPDAASMIKGGVPLLSANNVVKWATKPGLLGDVYREASRRQKLRTTGANKYAMPVDQGTQNQYTHKMRMVDNLVLDGFVQQTKDKNNTKDFLNAVNAENAAHGYRAGFSGLPPADASLLDIGDLGRLNSAIGTGVNINPVLSAGTKATTFQSKGNDAITNQIHKEIEAKIRADSGQSTVYQTLRQGVYTMDEGPFLRGLGMDAARQLVKAGFVGEQKLSGRSDYSEGRCRGDDVAFAVLDDKLVEMGLFDWTPDGILLSKFDNMPLDKLEDQRIDARDGALYNVCIQGPALTTTWTGDPSMEVLPMDKVFVVVVADVLLGGMQLSTKLPVGPAAAESSVADAGTQAAALASFQEAADALRTFQLIPVYDFTAQGGGTGTPPKRAVDLTDKLTGAELVVDAGNWFPLTGGATWADAAGLDTLIKRDDVRAQMTAALQSIGPVLSEYRMSDGTSKLTLPNLASLVDSLAAADAAALATTRTAVQALLVAVQTEVHADAIKPGVAAAAVYTAAANFTAALLNLQVRYAEGYEAADIDNLNTALSDLPKKYFVNGKEYFDALGDPAKQGARLAAANKINAMLPSSAQLQIRLPASTRTDKLPAVQNSDFAKSLETFSDYLTGKKKGTSTEPSRKDFMSARAKIMEATQLVKTGDGKASGTGLSKSFGVSVNSYEDWLTEAEIEYRGTQEKLRRRLCNFRVQLATSSQIINSSALQFDTNGEQMPGSRMGLKLGTRVSEYIVGGWCIGTVTDAAASRASMPSGMPMGPRSAPNTAAINLHVNIEWWNGDKMHRSYCNYKGKDQGLIRPRFQQPEQDAGGSDILSPEKGSVNQPAEAPPVNVTVV